MNPIWAVILPLLVIPFIQFFGEKRNNLREASIIVTGLLLFLVNESIYQAVINGELAVSGEFVMMPGLSLALSAEPLGVLFGLLASSLWVITTVYSIGYMRGHNEQHQTRFYTCFAIALSAVMAAAYADNLLTLFVAYEMLSLSTFPLVTHAGTDAARKAGRVYLGILLGGSIGLFLPAMVWVYAMTGTLDFVPGGIVDAEQFGPGLWVLLALFVFGIGKAAVMPFHRWLPAAMVAPTPVSALLHAVAVVKTGVFSLLKIVTYIFGVDTMLATGISEWLIVFPAATILIASIIAFSKTNLKARLAYSTISQLSYIVLAALLASSTAIVGGGLHILTHAFAKITLFFCAGAIMVAAHKKDIRELDGIGRQMPITMLAFFIGSLGIIGLPPVAGVWSKVMIAQGSLQSGEVWILAVLMLSTLLNIGYLLPISIRAFYFAPPNAADSEHAPKSEPAAESEHTSDAVQQADSATPATAGHSVIQEAPAASLWAIVMTATLSVLLFFYPQPVIELLEMIQWR